MRLGSLLLIPSVLVAQVPETKRALPWEHLQEPSWQLGTVGEGPVPPPKGPPDDDLPIRVEVHSDGSIRILDTAGLVALRVGLPGRPIRAWRDAGIPVDLSRSLVRFPLHSGLDGGIGSLNLTPGEDLRPFLSGLLWVLDDGERILTILNPGWAQVVYVPLPEGGNLDLRFYPDRLEAWTGGDTTLVRHERVVWTLPWVALLPQFLNLASPRPAGPRGTALKPFPNEQPGGGL